jgi:membrane associated rhomboid family serine protease
MNNISMRFYVIALNVVFFIVFYLGNRMGLNLMGAEHLVLSSQSINYPLSILNNNFMHGGLLHLIMNMFFVYQFGELVDNKYNKKEQIFLYFGTGIIISLIMIGYFIFLNPTMSVVGYSGIACALLGATFKDLDSHIQKSLLIQFGIFHVFIIFSGFPISWESHLLGGLIGFLYSQNRFLNNKIKRKFKVM